MLAGRPAARPWGSYRHRMAKGWNGVVLTTVVVVALFAAGQSDSDDDSPVAGSAAPAENSAPSGSGRSGSGRSDGGPSGGGPQKDQEAVTAELVADPVADECVLTAPEAQALTDIPVERTVMTSIPGPEERPHPGCVAVRGESQFVLMNVYGVRPGEPADAVRAAPAGSRSLDGVGRAAVVVPARAGPTLQVAGDTYLVTIAVAGVSPTDDAWRAAGNAALDRLE